MVLRDDNAPNFWLQRPPTVNPYRFAISELLHRLRWDLCPESWRSREILRTLRNRYCGRRAVILCNGPSLLRTNFDLLTEVATFGLNKINLLFDKTEFRPSFLVSVNPLVIEQNSVFFNETDVPLFLDSSARRYVKCRPNVVFLRETRVARFARDCSMSVYQGFTVTFVAMQLAAHMGFRDVALVGCDHNFTTKGPANLTVTSGSEDPNHFDPNYFAGGLSWQLPDLVQSEISYLMAAQMFEAMGGRIVNCTDGGELKIYPRMTLSEFLEFV